MNATANRTTTAGGGPANVAATLNSVTRVSAVAAAAVQAGREDLSSALVAAAVSADPSTGELSLEASGDPVFAVVSAVDGAVIGGDNAVLAVIAEQERVRE